MVVRRRESRRYDVLVVGGGLAGATAAISAARLGCRVALAEQRGGLGWEVTRAWCGFGDHAAVGLAGELLGRLDAIGGLGAQCVIPALLEGLLDELALNAGVELLFHAWPHEVVWSANRAAGALLATRFGLLPIKASVVVDATHQGILLRTMGAEMEALPPAEVHHAVILTRATVAVPLILAEGLPPPVTRVELRPIGPQEACAMLVIDTSKRPPGTDVGWWAEISSARALVPVLERLRRIPQLSRCEVAFRADEPWALPAAVARVVPETGVLGAGAFCPGPYRAIAAGASVFSTLVEAGEKAGREAARAPFAAHQAADHSK